MGIRPASIMPGQFVSSVSVEGNSVRPGRAVSGMKQLLLFERGHWCSACRRHMTLVSDQTEEFDRRGIQVAAIVHESTLDASERSYTFPVIADPDMQIASTFEMVHVDEFGKETIRPAAILIDEMGKVLFSYVGDDSRDRPTLAALFLAFDSL